MFSSGIGPDARVKGKVSELKHKFSFAQDRQVIIGVLVNETVRLSIKG